MAWPAAYKARAKERGGSGFQRPGAANDNRPGGMNKPANDNMKRPRSIPIGRPHPGLRPPLPVRTPWGGVGGYSLMTATDIYVRALEGYTVGGWQHIRTCRSGIPHPGYLQGYGSGCYTTPQFGTPRPWETTTNYPYIYRVEAHIFGGVPSGKYYWLDVFKRIGSKTVPDLSIKPVQAFALPQPFPVQNPARPPKKPKCGGQPHAKPKPKTLPNPNKDPYGNPSPQPGLPPIVDAASAAAAGYKPPGLSVRFSRGGKPKVGRGPKPSSKPKKPSGRPEPPKSGPKMGKGGKAVWWLVNSATEGIDVLQAAHDALPDDKKTGKKNAYGVNKPDPFPTIPEMVNDLWHGSDSIDTGKMVENMINNQIEDAFFGLLGGAGKKANQATGMATGADRALGAPMGEGDFDLPQIDIDWSACTVKLTF